MTASHIPKKWLIPDKYLNSWKFVCSTSIKNLVETNRAALYFRKLTNLIEDDYHILDYHLRLIHDLRNNMLVIYVYFDNSNSRTNPQPTNICISCDISNAISDATLLSTQQYTRSWLDGRARTKLILTPIRHVERLSELIDENGEMEAFWRDSVELVKKESGVLHEFHPEFRINHGTCRTHSHLHLKINFPNNVWQKGIAVRYQDRIATVKQLLQDSNVVSDCFGKLTLRKENMGVQKSSDNNDNNAAET